VVWHGCELGGNGRFLHRLFVVGTAVLLPDVDEMKTMPEQGGLG